MFRSFQPGGKDLALRAEQFSIIQKDIDHASSKYGDFVDSGDNVVVPNVEAGKDKAPPARTSRERPCRISCASWEASGCTLAICRVIQHPMDVSECRSSWRRISSTPFRQGRQSQSRIKGSCCYSQVLWGILLCAPQRRNNGVMRRSLISRGQPARPHWLIERVDNTAFQRSSG